MEIKNIKITNLLLFKCSLGVLLSFFLVYQLAYLFFTSDFVHTRVIHQIDEFMGEINFQLDSAEIDRIRWRGIQGPLSFSLENIHLTPKKLKIDKNLECRINRVTFGLDFWSLILGRLEVKKLSVKQLKLFRTQEAPFLFGELTGQIKHVQNNIDVKIDHLAFNPKELAVFIPSLSEKLAGIDIPLSISGRFAYRDKILKSGYFLLTSSTGKLALDPFYPKNLSYNLLKCEIVAKDNILVLKDFHFNHPLEDGTALPIQLRGILTLEDSPEQILNMGGSIGIELEGGATHIPVDGLSYLWPKELAEKARVWVTENLSVGIVPKATLKLKGRYIRDHKLQSDRFIMMDLGGDIDAENVSVRYLDELPLVTGARGHCQYGLNHFTIQAEGQVNDLKLASGKILISDFDKEDQIIDIQLELLGAVERAMEIIGMEPLAFPQKLGFNSKLFKGESHTNLHLIFPLISELPLEKINVKSQSTIFNGKVILPKRVYDIDSLLTEGAFHLFVDNHHLELEGSGSCFNYPTSVNWVEHFKPDGEHNRSEFSLVGYHSGRYEEENSKRFTLDYQIDFKKKGSVDFWTDLSYLEFSYPFISLYHEKETPLNLTFRVTVDSKNNFTIKQGEFKGKTIDVSCEGILPMGDGRGGYQDYEGIILDQLKFNVKELGDLKGQFKVKGSLNDPKIQGDLPFFDLNPYLEKVWEENDQKWADFGCDLAIESLKMSDELSLKNASCTFDIKNGVFHSLHLTSKDNNALDFVVTPSKETSEGRIQKISLQCRNAGDFLDCFMKDNDLEGGILNLVGHTEQIGEEKTFVAEIDVRDVIAVKAPFLAQLLAAGSFQGIMNSLTGGGIHFDRCTGKVSIKNKKIFLQDLHMAGDSIALDIDGTVFLESSQLDLTGEIYPLHGINYLMAKIPLVGGVLSGGTSKGIFSTAFVAKGNLKQPQIKINPLTTIAPTGIRKMMDNLTGPSDLESEVSQDVSSSKNGG